MSNPDFKKEIDLFFKILVPIKDSITLVTANPKYWFNMTEEGLLNKVMVCGTVNFFYQEFRGIPLIFTPLVPDFGVIKKMHWYEGDSINCKETPVMEDEAKEEEIEYDGDDKECQH